MTKFRIDPGEFRHVITFQKRIDVQNDYGEENEWVDVVRTRAGIYPVSGSDVIKINMRYIKGITSDMRIKSGNRIFELISPPVNFQEKNTLIQLQCKELI